jgi:hypothetical protein
MAELAENRRFTVDRETFGRLRETFVADWVSNDTSLRTIDRVHREHGYLMDPHTAVAWEVAERLRDANPVLVVSTAHWAKFGADVLKALTGTPYGASLDPQYAACPPRDARRRAWARTRRPPIPGPLAELATLPRRFDAAIDRSGCLSSARLSPGSSPLVTKTKAPCTTHRGLVLSARVYRISTAPGRADWRRRSPPTGNGRYSESS